MVLRPHFYATQVLNSTQTPQDRHRHCHEPIPKSPIHRRLSLLLCNLEDHLVRPVTLPQAEVGGKVSLEQRLLLDSGQEGLVDLLLVLCALGSNLLLGWCLALLEESLLGALLVGLLVPGEVLLARDLGNGGGVDAVDWDGGLGGDHVAGVDAAERDTVDLKWASNEQDTLLKSLEEDHTLATETASEQDEDGAGCERCAGLVWAESLAGLFFDMLVLIIAIVSFCAFHLLDSAISPLPPPFSGISVPFVAQTRPRPGSICWPAGQRV